MDLILRKTREAVKMDTNIRNAITKMNAATGYDMGAEVSRTMSQPWEKTETDPDAWYAMIYNTEGMMEIEFIEREGGVVASVMNRFNFTTAKVVRIMDVLMEYMPISPPGGD